MVVVLLHSLFLPYLHSLFKYIHIHMNRDSFTQVYHTAEVMA